MSARVNVRMSSHLPRHTSPRRRPRLLHALVRLLSIVALCAAYTVRVAEAHPIHTTLTVVTPAHGNARLMIRVFADDFAAVVAQHAGKPTPADSSVSTLDAMRYVGARVQVQTGAGRPMPLVSCGLRREANVYWVCLRVPLPANRTGVTLQQQLLTELHTDQVNIVQVTRSGGMRTMLFTRKSAPARLSS